MKGLARTESGVAHTDEPRPRAVRFCTHCGAVQDDAPQRVCGRCGLGVLLACAPGLLTTPRPAFLVVKSDLRISAASVGVRPLLGDPDALAGVPLLDVLAGDPNLPRWIARAAMGSQRVTSVALRRGATRVNGRVAACGAPPAALLILQ